MMTAQQPHGVVVPMTQQYLGGELSLLLARLQDATRDQACVRDISHLRREVEARPLVALRTAVVRALALTESLCWDSLQRGETAAFVRQATISAELYDFGDRAGLLDGDYST
jgi:hypothetical protein